MERRAPRRSLATGQDLWAPDLHPFDATEAIRRSNRAAIKLYRGLDFTALGVRAGYYSDNGEGAVEMILALDPTSGKALPGRDEIPIDG